MTVATRIGVTGHRSLPAAVLPVVHAGMRDLLGGVVPVPAPEPVARHTPARPGHRPR
ncbi:hypothetical protein [Streptomyces sp. NPDC006739]|uniref:hypothetical protein n=1 Tax=Streptomyces sp. NPDC006739 TaxID=3364763 RepID=UPI00369BA837